MSIRKKMLLNNLSIATLSLSSIALITIPSAIAANDTHLTTAPKSPSEMVSSDVVPQTTCKLALLAQAEKPAAYNQEKIMGRVYNVLGSNVYMQLDNGSTYIANLSTWERGKLGNIIGRRLVITPYYCNRANLDTTLYFTPAKAIEVPPLTFSNSTTTPPLTPRPEAPMQQSEPAQETPRQIIPQTW
jgi:hypothetical protein